MWNIGTGYFGCRTDDGKFSEERFVERCIQILRKLTHAIPSSPRATLPNVKMIEIKLSQGAKPAHGGILPAAKVSKDIAAARGMPMVCVC